jgi:hypothetical protein
MSIGQKAYSPSAQGLSIVAKHVLKPPSPAAIHRAEDGAASARV